MNKLLQQYEQNVQVYKNLDLTIPVDLKTVKSELTKHQKAVINKGKGQLVIAPEITKDFTLFNLVESFDKKQVKSWIYKTLWEQYDLTGLATINVISLTAGNDYGDLVTQHTNKTIEEQRKIKGEFMSPVESIILAALFRLDNKYLASNTFIRFPQLPDKTVVGSSVVGDVYSRGGRFGLDGSGGDAYPRDGVGLSVGQRVTLGPQASTLSSVIFSEAEAISLLKKAGYKIMKEF